MATFAGGILGGTIEFVATADVGALAPLDGVQTEPTRARESQPSQALGSPLANRQPLDIRNVPQIGGILRTFFEDYYNRVYLIPGVIDFKAVAIDATRNFDVWNAWLKPIFAESVLVTAAGGTDITGPAPATRFAPLAIRRYEAQAFVDGPATFRASYRLQFDTGERPTLTLIGERARRLPATPAWGGSARSGGGSSGFTISYEFKTEIMVSRSGREQRRRLRQSPRRSLAYSSMVWHDGARAFNQHMRDWQNRVVVLPEEPTFVRLTAAAGIGSTGLQVKRIPPWLRPGATVFVRNRFFDMVTEVTAAEGNAVSIGSPLDFAAAPGARIVLASYGRLDPEITSRRETNNVFVTAISAQINPASEEPRLLPEPEVVIAGRPVFDMRANWGSPPDVTYLQPRETLDYGQGRVQVFTPIEFSNRSTNWVFSGRTEKLEKVVDHFYRMSGRAGEFYYPSWEQDISTDILPIVAGTRSMSVATDELFRLYGEDTVHGGVAIILKNGEVRYNVMSEKVAVGEERSLFTFVQDWAEPIEPGDIAYISWLYVCRFATDRIEVEWLSNEAGQVQCAFLTLEALAADEVV